MTMFSFSLPAIRGSSASNTPSSLPKPAFSYFQGLPVKSSRSFPEVALLKQPVLKNAAVRVNMVHFENIRRSIFYLKGRETLSLNTKGLILLLTYKFYFILIFPHRIRNFERPKEDNNLHILCSIQQRISDN